tara:strand:- start:64 stop:534 length:471 start_codon:yes stop_codon:yes gene_type:complete
MDEATAQPPPPQAEPKEKMLFLQEQMVNFVRQYSLPVIEVSLVVSKYLKQLTSNLQAVAEQSGEALPPLVAQPWPLEVVAGESEVEMPLERILTMVDEERMDIFDTIIRVVLTQSEMSHTDAVLLLREWEKMARTQLASVSSPGQLFSPFELSEEF